MLFRQNTYKNAKISIFVGKIYRKYLFLSVKYSISDQISAGISAIIFIPGPERQGQYGVYKDLSSLCINAKFSF